MLAHSTRDISIITTCKGRLHHLKQSLPAMLAQQCPFNYEVIVVDYGCPDGTYSWCQEQGDSRLVAARVVDRTEYFSPSRARNCGAWAAEGRVLAFVDADVVLSADWLRNACGPVLQGDANLCYVEPGKGPWDLCGTCAVEREWFHQVRGYDESFDGWGPEDGDLYDRLKQAGASFHWFSRSLANPIRHDNQERTRHFREKSITKSERLNKERVSKRNGPVNPADYGVAEIEVVWAPGHVECVHTGELFTLNALVQPA